MLNLDSFRLLPTHRRNLGDEGGRGGGGCPSNIFLPKNRFLASQVKEEQEIEMFLKQFFV